MTNTEHAIKHANKGAEKDVKIDNHGENIALMEPMLIPEGSRSRPELIDMALDLTARSAGFRRSMPGNIVTALSDLVRSMNCYYSNLIEGHNTHPVEIEKALKGDYSGDKKKRNLQLEAKAHIAVQKWIDEGSLLHRATSGNAIREIHRRFCAEVPPELLIVEDPVTHEKFHVEPGELRTGGVAVGKHIAISGGAIPRFLDRFEAVYSNLGRMETILATAAAHHRLAWIHPFLDGNGRVARLMTHATLLETLDTGALWSVARGLARRVDDYKALLANCDQPRRNDLDGRGNLSEEALVTFTRFFLEVCIDQVKFMESLMRPDELRARVIVWAKEQAEAKTLAPKADKVLEALLRQGELPRGEVPEMLNTNLRTAQRAVTSLIKQGVILSESPRAPLRLAFPAKLASRWMPGLFPPKNEA
jgi:Fic family protein